MNITELPIGETILKYKSPFALQRESDEIYAWFWREYEKLERIDGLRNAVLDGDANVLAKAGSSELETAKSDVANMKAKPLSMASLERLAGVMREMTKRLAENKEEARRSRRCNEAWNMAPPGGTWLPPTIH